MRGLAVVAAIAIVNLAGCGAPPSSSSDPAASAVQIGGPFRLVDEEGQPVTQADLLGKPTVMFFGFTYCPEVCPTTLAELTTALKALGRDADRLNVVFVSLDPERDTPAQLKTYLSSFDPRIRGLTGDQTAVDAMAKAYRVYHKRVPLEGGGYTVDHSSAVYLFDSKGRFVDPIGYGNPPERTLAQLKKLVARG